MNQDMHDYDIFLDWVAENYPTLFTKMERKLCRCFKGKRLLYIESTYPACVEILWVYFEVEELETAYFGAVVEVLKKKYPYVVMEYYMIGKEEL